MYFKIPRKKLCTTTFAGLIYTLALVLALSAIPLLVIAGVAQDTDRALFWSVHKDGKQVGYVLGTIHSEDPRVLDFSPDFLQKLGNNTIFAMELVPDLPTLAQLTETMHYPPGKTLEAVIGPDRFKALVAALSGYRVPVEFISRMKPWAAMMTLSTPPPKTGFFMDLSLSLRASGRGLEVIGLETLEQQLSFLEQMPMPMQLKLLDQAIAEFDQVKAVHEQMVNAYLGNDLRVLQSLSDEQMQAVDEKTRDYFIESGIHARNLRMLKTLLPYFKDNAVFVAVGALHLPGEQGLLNSLRHEGFTLKPLGLPFIQDPQD